MNVRIFSTGGRLFLPAYLAEWLNNRETEPGNPRQHPLTEFFGLKPPANFAGQPDADEPPGARGDIINKNAPESSPAR
jgi:hypothetical protein